MLEKAKLFFGFDSTEEEMEASPKPTATTAAPQPTIKGMIKGLPTRQTGSRLAVSEIKIEEPRVYEDSLTIATRLRDNRPVIVNLKHMDTEAGKRLIDFVCGTAYAINGHMLKIGENIFLFTPASILIVDAETKSPVLTDREDLEVQEPFFLNRAAG